MSIRAFSLRPRTDTVRNTSSARSASACSSSTVACDSYNSIVPMRSPGIPASLAMAPTRSPGRTLSRLPTARKRRCFPPVSRPPDADAPDADAPDADAPDADAPDADAGSAPCIAAWCIATEGTDAVRALSAPSSRRAPSYRRNAAAAISTASCESSSGPMSASSLAVAPALFTSVDRIAVRN